MRRTTFWLAIAMVLPVCGGAIKQAAAERDMSLRLGTPTKFGQSAKNYELKPRFKRQTVAFASAEAPGTLIIETRKRFLYYVLGNGKALRYGVGVGRDGFTWSGTEKISRMAEWPDWRAPKDMLERRPDIPEFVKGGPENPLGARALYLGGTEYRIHGTPAPWTIGYADSSGCIRMTNEDVTDLYQRVKIGTKVIVR